jgi:multidrug efflux pump subunit AcrB
MPPDDLSQTQVTVTLPPGSTYTADPGFAAELARTIVQSRIEHVKLVYTAMGGGATGSRCIHPRKVACPMCARPRLTHQHDAPARSARA